MLHLVNLAVNFTGESHYLQHAVVIHVCSLSQVSKLPLFETGSGFQGSLERFQNEQLMNTSVYQDLYNQGANRISFYKMQLLDITFSIL